MIVPGERHSEKKSREQNELFIERVCCVGSSGAVQDLCVPSGGSGRSSVGKCTYFSQEKMAILIYPKTEGDM